MKSIFLGNYAKFAYLSFTLIIFSTVIYVFKTKEYTWTNIIWNDFLAVIPLFAALFTQHFYERKKNLPAVLSGCMWLLFFPNSPYMLTDLKYIASLNDMVFLEYQSTGVNVNGWLFIMNLAVTVSLGVLFGMMSMLIVHRIINERFGRALGAVFCTVSIILSSFAIYIGRYARVNSWDIVRPKFLIETSIQSLTHFSLYFILIFSLTTAMLYFIFYAAYKLIIQRKGS